MPIHAPRHRRPKGDALRLLSWNILRGSGARCFEIAALVRRHAVDVAVFQEAWEDLDGLPTTLGGFYRRLAMGGRRHGPAVWTPHPMEGVCGVDLPVAGNWDLPSPVLKPPAQRIALVARVLGFTLATVHLDHGQLANRRQFAHLVHSRPDVDVVAGDFNAIGPVLARGFSDVGPRAVTHMAWGVVPLRLDRCVTRGMRATSAEALDRGASDHRPILVVLAR
ncbi:MAG TPA: endonuclease/exonuclease/phosphatase family protein [Acetobacteraceae bacterium]